MKKLGYIFLVVVISYNVQFAEEWQVKKTEDNLVKFTSSTSLLDFDGITSEIDGYIYWEGEDLFGKNNEFYFEVDLNSVETGIGKRDRDMREDVLETDKWPKTSFKGKIIDYKVSESNSNKYEIKSEGVFFLHGKEKKTNIDASITINEEVMNVQTNFSVFLDDYDIAAPSLLAFIKVADEIKLQLDFELNKVTEKEN